MPEVGENVQAQENQVQHQNRNINVNRNVNDDPNAPIDINLNRERREIAGGPQLLNRASISQNINIGENALRDNRVDFSGQQRDYLPQMRIMQNAAQLTMANAGQPLATQVLNANHEVGLNLSANSVRHSHRVSNARKKLAWQRSLNDLKQRQFQVDGQEANEYIDRFEASANVKGYLFEKDGDSPEETLLKHYSRIKTDLQYIPIIEHRIDQANNRAGLSDRQRDLILKHQAKLMTLKDIRTYYQTVESFMSNKYYALLPRGEMLKLNYGQLRQKLYELYNAEERNNDLILYYQDLIRLKQLDIKDEKSIKERQDRYYAELKELNTPLEDKRKPANELKKIAASYKELTETLNKKGNFLKPAEKRLRVKQFFDVYSTDLNSFENSARSKDITKLLNAYRDYQRENAAENAEEETTEKYVSDHMPQYEKKLEKSATIERGLSLSDKQKETLRRVQGFILRRAIRDKEDAFAYHFLQVKPEQQMMIFYLIENKKTEQAMGSDMISALFDYTPNLEVIKARLSYKVSSRLNWRLFSDATQATKSYGADISDFAKLSDKIQESDSSLREIQNNNGQPRHVEEGRKIIESITYRASVLQLLYRTAGMNYDMPPDMAQDRKLREKLFTEYNKITELAARLEVLITDHREEILREQALQVPEKGQEGTFKEDNGANGGFLDTVTSANKNLAYVTNAETWVGKPLDYYVSAVKDFRTSAPYGYPSGAINAVASLLTVISSVYGLFKVAGSGTMSFADKFGQGLSHVGSLGSGLAKGGDSTVKILKLTGVAGQQALDTTLKTVGIVNIITGTIKTISGGIQLGRTISSGRDVTKAKDELERIKQQRLAQNNADGREGPVLNADEEKLQVFLNHKNRDNYRKGTSAAVGMITGIATAASGFMTATGILAPLGLWLGVTASVAENIYKLVVDRKWKHRNRERAVDEYLRVDDMVKDLKTKHGYGDLGEGDLRKMARDEAMGQLGFGSVKICFKHICTGIATVLYKKVFVERPENEEEARMYENAINSLGLKVKRPQARGETGKPTVASMVQELMK